MKNNAITSNQSINQSIIYSRSYRGWDIFQRVLHPLPRGHLHDRFNVFPQQIVGVDKVHHALDAGVAQFERDCQSASHHGKIIEIQSGNVAVDPEKWNRRKKFYSRNWKLLSIKKKNNGKPTEDACERAVLQSAACSCSWWNSCPTTRGTQSSGSAGPSSHSPGSQRWKRPTKKKKQRDFFWRKFFFSIRKKVSIRKIWKKIFFLEFFFWEIFSRGNIPSCSLKKSAFKTLSVDSTNEFCQSEGFFVNDRSNVHEWATVTKPACCGCPGPPGPTRRDCPRSYWSNPTLRTHFWPCKNWHSGSFAGRTTAQNCSPQSTGPSSPPPGSRDVFRCAAGTWRGTPRTGPFWCCPSPPASRWPWLRHMRASFWTRSTCRDYAVSVECPDARRWWWHPGRWAGFWCLPWRTPTAWLPYR